jgi:hypothetical protein
MLYKTGELWSVRPLRIWGCDLFWQDLTLAVAVLVTSSWLHFSTHALQPFASSLPCIPFTFVSSLGFIDSKWVTWVYIF